MADTIPYLVDENDPDLESGTVEYGSCTGYLSRPKGGANLGSVIVIHENVGLVDHIKDVARHFAKEGFARWPRTCCNAPAAPRSTRPHRTPSPPYGASTPPAASRT